jgi:pimeloyl-ACP methyl ester carboxylesterase
MEPGTGIQALVRASVNLDPARKLSFWRSALGPLEATVFGWGWGGVS